MKFRGDDRAVVIQIGAVLLLAAIVIAMTGYQATVVPDQNSEIEFNHNQQVQSQLQELRNGIVSTPGGGSGGSHTVSLGTSYPARALFVNPAPASGQLRTAESGAVRIENATVSSNEPESIGDFWAGDDQSWNTSRLEYRPGYSEYDSAPTTVYEHTRLYNRHPRGGATSITGQRLVQDGDTITIVALRGDLQESSSGSVSVDARALSSSANTVPIESDGTGNVTITLPTENPDYWNDTVRDVDGVHDVSIGGETVTIELEDGSYDLRMAAVGVGDVDRQQPVDRAAYVVPTDDSAPTVVAEVRDEFNNPVSGVPVTVTGGTATRERTDGDGRIEISGVEAGDTVDVEVDGTAIDTQFDVEAGGSGGGGGGGGAYSVLWNEDKTAICEDECTMSATQGETAELWLETSPTVDGASVDYAVSDQSLATVEPSSELDSGEASTVLTVGEDASDGDTVTVFASSGSGGDALDVTMTNDGVPPQAPSASIDGVVDNSADCDRNPGGNCRGGGSPSMEFQVDWSASDANEDLTDVQVELVYDGTVVDSYSEPIDGEVPSASNTTTLEDTSGNDRLNDSYTIRVTATDSDGQSTTVQQTEVADEN